MLQSVNLVAASSNQLLIYTQNNQLYYWKKVSNLGNVPLPLSFARKIVFVSVSEGHCGAVDDYGHSFLWGNNSKGQVCHQKSKYLDKPTQVMQAEIAHCKSVFCHQDYTVLITVGGKIYASGSVKQNGYFNSQCRAVENSQKHFYTNAIPLNNGFIAINNKELLYLVNEQLQQIKISNIYNIKEAKIFQNNLFILTEQKIILRFDLNSISNIIDLYNHRQKNNRNDIQLNPDETITQFKHLHQVSIIGYLDNQILLNVNKQDMPYSAKKEQVPHQDTNNLLKFKYKSLLSDLWNPTKQPQSSSKPQQIQAPTNHEEAMQQRVQDIRKRLFKKDSHSAVFSRNSSPARNSKDNDVSQFTEAPKQNQKLSIAQFLDSMNQKQMNYVNNIESQFENQIPQNFICQTPKQSGQQYLKNQELHSHEESCIDNQTKLNEDISIVQIKQIQSPAEKPLPQQNQLQEVLKEQKILSIIKEGQGVRNGNQGLHQITELSIENSIDQEEYYKTQKIQKIQQKIEKVFQKSYLNVPQLQNNNSQITLTSEVKDLVEADNLNEPVKQNIEEVTKVAKYRLNLDLDDLFPTQIKTKILNDLELNFDCLSVITQNRQVSYQITDLNKEIENITNGVLQKCFPTESSVYDNWIPDLSEQILPEAEDTNSGVTTNQPEQIIQFTKVQGSGRVALPSLDMSDCVVERISIGRQEQSGRDALKEMNNMQERREIYHIKEQKQINNTNEVKKDIIIPNDIQSITLVKMEVKKEIIIPNDIQSCTIKETKKDIIVTNDYSSKKEINTNDYQSLNIKELKKDIVITRDYQSNNKNDMIVSNDYQPITIKETKKDIINHNDYQSNNIKDVKKEIIFINEYQSNNKKDTINHNDYQSHFTKEVKKDVIIINDQQSNNKKDIMISNDYQSNNSKEVKKDVIIINDYQSNNIKDIMTHNEYQSNNKKDVKKDVITHNEYQSHNIKEIKKEVIVSNEYQSNNKKDLMISNGYQSQPKVKIIARKPQFSSKAIDLALRKMFFRLDINVKLTKLEFMFNLKQVKRNTIRN